MSLKVEQIYFLQLYEMCLNIFSFAVIIYTFLLKQIETLSAEYSSASVVFSSPHELLNTRLYIEW